MRDPRDYLLKGDARIPDIARTAHDIEVFSRVPLALRLDYLAARSQALALVGLPGYEDAVEVARSLLPNVV